MQFGGPTEPDEEPVPPFQLETHIRVLDLQDRRPIGHELTGLTRPGLFLVRARVNQVEDIENGATIEKESASLGALSENQTEGPTGECEFGTLRCDFRGNIGRFAPPSAVLQQCWTHDSQVPLLPVASRHRELEGHSDGESQGFGMARIRSGGRGLCD